MTGSTTDRALRRWELVLRLEQARRLRRGGHAARRTWSSEAFGPHVSLPPARRRAGQAVERHA